MQTTTSPLSLGALIQRHWFKLVIIGFGLYLYLQKDFRFQVDMRAPATQEEVQSPAPFVPAPVVSAPAKMTATPPATIKITPPPAPAPPARMEMWSLGSPSTPVVTGAVQHLERVDESVQLQFLQRFAKVAISEQQKYGVPASITLANALLHSHAGQRDMARAGNNFFALPCDGATTTQGTYQGSCYRHFNNAWSSFRAHSQYVTNGSFESLRHLGSTDYRAWALALERHRFGEERELAATLVRLIEQFKLHELDQA